MLAAVFKSSYFKNKVRDSTCDLLDLKMFQTLARANSKEKINCGYLKLIRVGIGTEVQLSRDALDVLFPDLDSFLGPNLNDAIARCIRTQL